LIESPSPRLPRHLEAVPLYDPSRRRFAQNKHSASHEGSELADSSSEEDSFGPRTANTQRIVDAKLLTGKAIKAKFSTYGLLDHARLASIASSAQAFTAASVATTSALVDIPQVQAKLKQRSAASGPIFTAGGPTLAPAVATASTPSILESAYLSACTWGSALQSEMALTALVHFIERFVSRLPCAAFEAVPKSASASSRPQNSPASNAFLSVTEETVRQAVFLAFPTHFDSPTTTAHALSLSDVEFADAMRVKLSPTAPVPRMNGSDGSDPNTDAGEVDVVTPSAESLLLLACPDGHVSSADDNDLTDPEYSSSVGSILAPSDTRGEEVTPPGCDFPVQNSKAPAGPSPLVQPVYSPLRDYPLSQLLSSDLEYSL
jgi:hypothetical protein